MSNAGRPQKWESDAARMQAKRERQREEAEAHELAVKVRYGYAESETRTEAERAEVAARMCVTSHGVAENPA